MVNIYEILLRAASLKEETTLNSISPERAGGIMYDTLLALNDLWLQQGSALVISKIYASVSAMEADTAPVSDLTGKPLRPGQIVVIASSDSDNGSVYRYNGTDAPSWSLVGAIGSIPPVDSLDSDSTTLPLAAHQGKVLDGKIGQLGQSVDNKQCRKYLIGNDNATVSKTASNNIATTYTGLEREKIISELDALVESIESINYNGCITIGKMEATYYGNSITLQLFFYDDKVNEVARADIDSAHSRAFNFDIATLRNNNYIAYCGVAYSNIAVRVKFAPQIDGVLSSLVTNEKITYDASNLSAKFTRDGFIAKDVTNAVFNNSYPNLATYLGFSQLFGFNDAIQSFTSNDKYIWNVYSVRIVNENILDLRFKVAEANAENSMADFHYAEIRINLSTNEGIVTVPLNYYNSIIGYITLDLSKIVTTTDLTQGFGAQISAINPIVTYKQATPKLLKSGYIDEQGALQTNSSYNTYVVPINSDCKKAIIYGTFDKYGNIALCNKSGVMMKWVIINEGTTQKYSGDSTFNNLEVDVEGYSFICLSHKGNDSSLWVSVDGYDEEKAMFSYGALKYGEEGWHNIQSFRAFMQSNRNIVTAGEKSVAPLASFKHSEMEISFTDTFANYYAIGSPAELSYNTGALLEIGASGTKYFFSNKIESGGYTGGYHPTIWKEAPDGTKSQILSGGDLLPVDATEYPNYASIRPLDMRSPGNYAQTTFVKELSDGELLIGIRFNKDGDKYAVFRTYNNQALWAPKFVTSNETYIYDGNTYSSFCYPSKNNSIFIVNIDGQEVIVISEYGFNAAKYWRERGVSNNGLGVSGKVWASTNNGLTFKKIFDFDEKKNGDADDLSDDNWKWCTSYVGRMTTHIHCCYVDQVNDKVWITNGDSGNPGGKNSLYYISLRELVGWVNNQSHLATDPNDFEPKYVDNEDLPDYFHEFVMSSHDSVSLYANCVAVMANYQMYSLFATNNILLLGNDTARQTICAIHNNTVVKSRTLPSPDMFVDVVEELDADNPSTQITSFPQCIFRRNQDSPIVMLWDNKGVYISFNGIDWENKGADLATVIGFQSYAVKDTDGKYIIVRTEDLNYKNVKLLNY